MQQFIIGLPGVPSSFGGVQGPWSASMPKVYIILVNWNGWEDTIECLESVFRLEYGNFCVIVCDNGSTDDSLSRIGEWADGKIQPVCGNPDMKHLSYPSYPKPIPFLTMGPAIPKDLAGRNERLFLIQIGENLGFAGGNNVGLRIALDTGDLDYAWLLNNDTAVDPKALLHLVGRMEENPDSGICGSALLYYDDGKTVQALGGARYDWWTARVHHVGCGLKMDKAPPRQEVEQQLDYIVGASMLIRRAFLEDVGLMSERYFLFFEEIDWITRAKGRYQLVYSPESIVYHKQGKSTGEGSATSGQDDVAGLYGPRNRILYTRTHRPIALALVVPSVMASAAYRLLTGQFASFKRLISGAVAGAIAPIDHTNDRAN
ncbi:MAG TPA: glycosyltransferase family 2 protein [Terracidiphilus sp.]|nr:glycosyltransferase family 2 protein [Terracidiphilus sp.]